MRLLLKIRGNFMDVQNKVGIITGASSGIGLAMARLLSSKGAKVCLVKIGSPRVSTDGRTVALTPRPSN